MSCNRPYDVNQDFFLTCPTIFAASDFSYKSISDAIYNRGVSNTRPASEFCAARDAFWDFSNNIYVI